MLCTSKIREKVQFLSIILCPLSAEHSVTLPRVWWLCNEGFYYNTHCTVGGFAVGTLTLQILSFGTIKALVLMLHSPHFFPKYFAFFLKTLKYCNRRNVTRIIGKSSTGDEITAAIWYITDVCSTDFFFFFWVLLSKFWPDPNTVPSLWDLTTLQPRAGWLQASVFPWIHWSPRRIN